MAGFEEAPKVNPELLRAPDPGNVVDIGRSPGTGEGQDQDIEPLPMEVPDPGPMLAEVIELGARDSIFFNTAWFPKTFRQSPAIFHPMIYDIIDDPRARYCNIQVCRDGAKTTILRAYCAKRIAYGISRTVLFVALNETKAKQSVAWIKHQVETNVKFCAAFGLSRGKPWSDEHICILHGVERHPVHVIAIGVTGAIRGVNLDDWRPDLIVVDDVMDDENSSTAEQRDKIYQRIFGAIKYSLAAESEAPDAKMVLLNTPQDFQDVSERAKKDPQFRSASFGCWTKETEGLPIEMQESAWPERYPSSVLRNEKIAAIARNSYSIFAKEKECTLITPEDCAFKAEWLRFYGEGEEEPEPDLADMWVVIAIDPVPPPSQAQLDKGLKNKDFEAFAVVGKKKNKYYLLESVQNRGHDPGWTVTTFFELCIKYRPRKVLVESVAYQRTLAWILKKAMQHQARYWAIEEFVDKSKKYHRIVNGLKGVTSEGALYVRRNQTTFISQFTYYPGKNPNTDKDDTIESVAVALTDLQQGWIGEVADDWYVRDEENIPELEYSGGAP